MTEPTNEPAQEPAPSFDAEAFKNDLMQAITQREQGIQNGYQRQLDQLDAEYQSALGDLSEQDRAAIADAEQYVEGLQQQADAATANDYASRFPRASQLTDQLRLVQEDPEQFLSLLEQALDPDLAAQVAPVDANNPAWQTPASLDGVMFGSNGEAYTREMRRDILQKLSDSGLTAGELFARERGAR